MPGLVTRNGPAVSLVFDQDIILSEEGTNDLAITVIGAVEADGSKHVTEIHIPAEICNKSAYLQGLVDASDNKSEITLDDASSKDNFHDKEGTVVWLAHLQGLTQQRMQVKENLKEWFDNWHDTSMAGITMSIYVARALAYPCYLFNHAAGYARVTKYLAYNHIGHVKERPPKGFKGPKHLHIGEREFVGPLNRARSGLRNSLHKSLYSRVGRILCSETSYCDCWDATIGRYQYALTRCEAWPVDDVVLSSSISQIINRLKGFKYDYTPKCQRCRTHDWETIVLRALSNTNGYFNGICLDCQDRSKPRGDNIDDEYEKHNSSEGGRWDTRCRIKHGQLTWYISWLGRPDIREKILRPKGYRAPDDE
ncbi:hypothetical protein BKA63DRAFT_559463 [Paraphoma chrysanthemicola]|nr:hypothetical protein BKA63DRAFT_559463 [Paraphoma chrysanthemicola]